MKKFWLKLLLKLSWGTKEVRLLMKRRRNKFVSLFCILHGMLMLSACGEKTTGTLKEEEIFSKTIHDFKGYTVQNLDEDETTNFVVYAKDVREIFMTQESNVLVSADEEELIYSFVNADESLCGMKKGDVFYGELPSEIPQVIAVKVKDIDIIGDSVEIHGEEMVMSDLITYAEIDMNVDTSHIMLVDIGENVTPEQNASPHAVIDSKDAASAHAVSYSKDAASALVAQPMKTTAVTKKQENYHFDLPLSLSANINISYADSDPNKNTNKDKGRTYFSVTGSSTLKGQYKYTLNSADVVWRYSKEDVYFNSSIVFNGCAEKNISFTGKGTIKFKQYLGQAMVRLPYFPLISAMGDLYATGSVSGSVTGGWIENREIQTGLEAVVPREGNGSLNRITNSRDVKRDVQVDKFEGTVRVGPEVELSIGMVGVARVYGTVGGGVEAKASYDPFDAAKETESLHDCLVCADGKIDAVFTAQAGARVDLIKKMTNVSLNVTFEELRLHLADFYLSVLRNGADTPEFGWNDCPYRRWKTTVSVANSEGGQLSNVSVTAQADDGRTFEEYTDESGKAILFLPVGDNTVEAFHEGEVGMTSILIEEQPVEAKLQLQLKRDIFIVGCSKHWGVSYDGPGTTYELWPEIEQALLAWAPHAIIVNSEEWYREGETDFYLDASDYEKYAISPGDIIIEVLTESYHTPATLGGSNPPGPVIEILRSMNIVVRMMYHNSKENQTEFQNICWWDFKFQEQWGEIPGSNGAASYMGAIWNFDINYDSKMNLYHENNYTFNGAGGAREWVHDNQEHWEDMLASPVPFYDGFPGKDTILQRMVSYIPKLYPYLDMAWGSTPSTQ